MIRNGPSFVLILSLGMAACNRSPLSPSPSPFPPSPAYPTVQATVFSVPSESALTPTPAITYQPTFESAPCAFPVPRGYDLECGYLIVPENRSRPDTRQIRLHVGIFRNRTGTPNADPVIKLSGGPGSSGLNTAGYLLNTGMDALLERRDFVVFDQRGTGYSRRGWIARSASRSRPRCSEDGYRMRNLDRLLSMRSGAAVTG